MVDAYETEVCYDCGSDSGTTYKWFCLKCGEDYDKKSEAEECCVPEVEVDDNAK